MRLVLGEGDGGPGKWGLPKRIGYCSELKGNQGEISGEGGKKVGEIGGGDQKNRSNCTGVLRGPDGLFWGKK